MNESAPDVIVLGGGVIGALSAYELAKRNRTVVLLDPHPFGSGASGNSAAMLEHQLDFHRGEPFNSLAKSSMDLFPRLHDDLRKLTGIDFQLDFCGILQLALDTADQAFLEKEVQHQKRSGLNASWFNAAEIKTRYPALTVPTFGGAFYAGDGQVDGAKFLQASLEAARRSGVTMRENVGKIRITPTVGELVVEAGGESYSPRSIVVAAGAWTDQVLAPFGFKTGIEPVRGQLVVLETQNAPLPHPVYTRTGGYITPKKDGYTLAGTTIEKAGFDSSTTSAGRDLIRKATEALMASLSLTRERGVTAGLRPKSPDEMPLLGFLPGRPDIFVAAGHYRNGVMLAPISAKIVAASLAGDPLPVNIAPFSPNRCLQTV